MSVRIRVIEETALCARCVHSAIMKRKADARHGGLGRTATFCQAIGTFVPSDLVECSRYAPLGQWPFAPWEVQRLALDVDPRGTPGQVL